MECKLGEVVDFKNGKRKPMTSGNIPIYGGNGILGYTDKYNAFNNSIIIGRVGAYCGCVYKCEHECWVSDNAIVGKVRENYDYMYVYYLMKTLNINEFHVGSGQPLMTQNILNNIIVDIPCYDEQIKVGRILNKLDKKIELNIQINAKLHEIGLSLVKKYMNQVTSEIELNRVINFIKGKKPNKICRHKIENYKKYLTIACLNGQEQNYADTYKMIISNKDLLMVMDGASSGDIYYSDSGVVGSTLAKVDIIDDNYGKGYIYFCIKRYANLIKSKNTGSAIPHTDKTFVGNILIPEIDINKQKKFDILLNKIQQMQKENEILIQLRNTVLPKLMNGEIELEKIKI